MNFDELDKLVSEAAGVEICPICRTPFKKYHSRQKTCGTDLCKKEWKLKGTKEWREKRIAENVESYRKYRNEVEKRYRDKKRGIRARDAQLEEEQNYWERLRKKDLALSDGTEYGARQIEKTLASVPKINTEIGGTKHEQSMQNEEDVR